MTYLLIDVLVLNDNNGDNNDCKEINLDDDVGEIFLTFLLNNNENIDVCSAVCRGRKEWAGRKGQLELSVARLDTEATITLKFHKKFKKVFSLSPHFFSHSNCVNRHG